MLNKEQIIEAKTNWIDLLTVKVENWKADTDIYIKNSENLLRDNVVDIIRGVWTETIIPKTPHRLAQIFIGKDGTLPEAFMVRLDAVTAIAAEMGIDIHYDMDFLDNGDIKIKWVLNEVRDYFIIDNHVSAPMELTRARVIEEVAENEVKEVTPELETV